MNIAIIGRTEILYDTAKLLNECGQNIKLIITSKEAAEYKKSSDDFRALAKDLNAEYIYSSSLNKEDVFNKIKSVGALDIGISLNFVNIITQKVIDLFSHGILNAHGGDLPRYRGNACQAWAILNGEPKIGLCIHKMQGGQLDSGDIIMRDYLNIEENTKIGDVWRWMGKQIPHLFCEAIEKLENDKDYFLEKQSDNPADQLRCYPRIPEDGRIDWGASNRTILRLINASSEPYSGAFCNYAGEKLIIWDAEIYSDNEKYCAVPGQIGSINKKDGSVIVITGDGKLKIKEIEYKDFRGAPGNIIKSIRKRLM